MNFQTQNNDQLFIYYVQIRLRPPAGSSDPEFKTHWEQAIRDCESKLLRLEVEFTERESLRLQNIAKVNFDKLSELIEDREVFRETEAAAHTVANRTKAERYRRTRAQWARDLEKAETKALGIKARQPNKLPKPSRPGPSFRLRDPSPPPGTAQGTQRRGGRVTKVAKRRYDKNTVRSINGEGRDDPQIGNLRTLDAFFGEFMQSYNKARRYHPQ